MRNKEAAPNRGLIRQNKKITDHVYRVRDCVILDRTKQKRKLNAPYTGPYRILKVYNNGTVKNNCGVYEENIHISCLKPYQKEKEKEKEKEKR